MKNKYYDPIKTQTKDAAGSGGSMGGKRGFNPLAAEYYQQLHNPYFKDQSFKRKNADDSIKNLWSIAINYMSTADIYYMLGNVKRVLPWAEYFPVIMEMKRMADAEVLPPVVFYSFIKHLKYIKLLKRSNHPIRIAVSQWRSFRLTVKLAATKESLDPSAAH